MVVSVEGNFSWEQTNDEEYCTFLGKMADHAGSPLALLTHWLRSFDHMHEMHASAVGHNYVNRDFAWDIVGTSKKGT